MDILKKIIGEYLGIRSRSDGINSLTVYGTMFDGSSYEKLKGIEKMTEAEREDDEHLPACCRNGRFHSHPV